MSIRLSFEPEVESSLVTQAEAQGLSVEKYLESIVSDIAAAKPPAQPMTSEQRSQAFEEWASAFEAENAPLDDTFNRESLYPPRW